MGLENIEHVVVLMMENRSLDNLLGWLYADSGGIAPTRVPPAGANLYDGLVKDRYFNRVDDADSPRVYASRPPTAWPPVCPSAHQVPTPDPNEEFE
jgi:phospholipase C